MIHPFADIHVETAIEVEKPLVKAFSFTADPANAAQISEHVTDVSKQDSDGYQRRLHIHRQSVSQHIHTVINEADISYRTDTVLYGWQVCYLYRFQALSPTRTRIQLEKSATIRGFWRLLSPLIHHLLTRPEHDGQHLQTLKNALEEKL